MTATSTTEQDTRPDVHEMHVRREAVDVIAACQERVNALGRYFGESSEYYQEAEQSFRHNLSSLFSMFFGRGCWISKDGELSLFVQTSSKFVFGMIFHEVKRQFMSEEIYAMAVNPRQISVVSRRVERIAWEVPDALSPADAADRFLSDGVEVGGTTEAHEIIELDGQPQAPTSYPVTTSLAMGDYGEPFASVALAARVLDARIAVVSLQEGMSE